MTRGHARWQTWFAHTARAGASVPLLIVWSLLVLAGFGALARYSYTPGDPGAPPGRWPSATALHKHAGRPTLVMFLHPHCPCSRASLEEFGRLLARVGDRADAGVVFVRPACFPEGWERTDLWSAATTMPGVHVAVDVDGLEARRFGVVTSGSTLLFDASGSLLFCGGITGARGHAGDNAGQSAVLTALLTGRVELQRAPVFGCSLFD